jgi:hypothetical protein
MSLLLNNTIETHKLRIRNANGWRAALELPERTPAVQCLPTVIAYSADSER